MTIGFNIKQLRKEKGITQGELADKSNLGLNIISKLERDTTDPKLSTLYKLMNALDCSADELIADERVFSQSNIHSKFNKQVKRASKLPEDEKEVLLKLIDKYCNATFYEIMVLNGEIPG